MEQTDNVIVEIPVGIATEITVEYPKGEILGFKTKKNIYEADILHMIVMTTVDSPLIKKDFYLLNSGDRMRKIDSLGQYYGSVEVHKRLLHIFRQNYKEPEVVKPINLDKIENKFWTV